MTEKLQKILAQTGLASRRTIEQWIQAGRITVNGQLAKLGDRALHTDKIKLDGKLVQLAPPTAKQVLLYHKPVGEICTRSDENNRPTVFQQLPPLKQGRWIAVGRLDLNTSGLLLFTNNGELANQLMHPRFNLEREYAVRVRGQVSQEMINTLLKGVLLEDGVAKFKKIEFKGGEHSNSWYHVVLT